MTGANGMNSERSSRVLSRSCVSRRAGFARMVRAPKRARAEFHAVRYRSRRSRRPSDGARCSSTASSGRRRMPGSAAKVGVDAAGKIASQIDVAEIAALLEPVAGPSRCSSQASAPPTGRPSSPIAGKMKTSSRSSDSASRRLSFTLAKSRPTAPDVVRDFSQAAAERTCNMTSSSTFWTVAA